MTFEQLLMWILVISGFGVALIVGLAWGLRNYLRSRTGKIIDRAKAQKKPLVLAASSGHLAKFLKVSEVFPGMLETFQFKKRLKRNRKVFRSAKNNPAQLTPEEIEDAKARELTEDCINAVLTLNAEKVFLEDGVPLTLAVDDRAISVGIKGLGAMAYFEKLCKIENIKSVIGKLKEKPEFKAVGYYLENLASQISLINLDTIRLYFDSDYSQEDAQHQNEFYYVQGYRDGQNKEHATEKIFIYGGIAMGILGIVGGVIIAFIA